MSAGRSIGMTIGYIPPSEYFAYCQFYGIYDDEFIDIMMTVDRRYVELANENTS